MTQLRRLLLPLLALVVLGVAFPAAAGAVGAGTTTSLSLTAPAAVRPGSPVTLRATLLSGGAPVAGASILFEVDVAGTWTPLGSAPTDPRGQATLAAPAPTSATTYRGRFDGGATYAGATSGTQNVTVAAVSSTLTLSGPKTLVDEHSSKSTLTWSGSDGAPVAGRAQVWTHTRGRSWRAGSSFATGSDGRAGLTIKPRVDTWYQVRGAAGPGWKADTSPTLFVDNLPPGRPVVLPTRAPKPHALPAQPRAAGVGAAVSVKQIPDSVWRSMAGRSWRPGCLPRTELRYLQVNYWGFDGYRHRGELVVRASAAGKFSHALKLLYAARIPIRSMYLPDRFGYSKRSGGANDFASMAADNTSAFNCRWVTGNPGVRSPHASGRAFDLDPFENPYLSRAGWLPNGWWVRHSNPRYAWRSSKHRVVRIMKAAGFRWTYRVGDAQHFDA
jgi:hypothetical protein